MGWLGSVRDKRCNIIGEWPGVLQPMINDTVKLKVPAHCLDILYLSLSSAIKYWIELYWITYYLMLKHFNAAIKWLSHALLCCADMMFMMKNDLLCKFVP